MKPRVREVIVVEGRYDKNALLQAVDAAVIETKRPPTSAVWRRSGG